MFKMLGVVVAVYALYAAVQGEVYAKSGPWGRRVMRADSPAYFWAVVVTYFVLSAALLTVF